MSNDYLAIMSAHADDVALVMSEAGARDKVIMRLKQCKTDKQKADARIWYWGARMNNYLLNTKKIKGITAKNVNGVVAAERAKKKDERATWYAGGDTAARNFLYHAFKEAGLTTADKRGGKRANAGRKGETTKPETAAKVETVKPVKDDKPQVATDYKPATARESAMFLRENIAALVSIAKGAHNSAAMIKALTAALAAAQKEIANCE